MYQDSGDLRCIHVDYVKSAWQRVSSLPVGSQIASQACATAEQLALGAAKCPLGSALSSELVLPVQLRPLGTQQSWWFYHRAADALFSIVRRKDKKGWTCSRCSSSRCPHVAALLDSYPDSSAAAADSDDAAEEEAGSEDAEDDAVLQQVLEAATGGWLQHGYPIPADAAVQQQLLAAYARRVPDTLQPDEEPCSSCGGVQWEPVRASDAPVTVWQHWPHGCRKCWVHKLRCGTPGCSGERLYQPRQHALFQFTRTSMISVK